MSAWTVPLTDVKVTEDDIEAVLDCLRSGWLTMGPRIAELEARFAEHVGAPAAVAVSSGTAALHLGLLAAGIGPGDEVLVPAFTFVAGANAARYVGATPVLVDSCGPHDLNLDPVDVAVRITPATKAILATHFMGYAADISSLRSLANEHDLALVEDCAQAIGAVAADGRPVGRDSTAACYSFFSKKQLAVGEGGMVTSEDPDIVAKVRSLRSHAMTSVTWDRHRGHAETYDILDIGFNYRMDEPRAALGLSRLGRVAVEVESRRAMVRGYRERLAEIPWLTVPWTDDDVDRASHFCFPILFETAAERTRVRSGLSKAGIQTTWYPALTTLTAYRDAGSRPVAEDIAERHLALPLSASFGEAEVDTVMSHLQALAP